MAQLVKNTLAMWETWVRSLGWENPLEKGKATHSGILAQSIPWTVSPWGRKESDTTTERFHSLTHDKAFTNGELLLMNEQGKWFFEMETTSGGRCCEHC